MKPGPGVSAKLLAGKARSWSLAAGSRDPRVDVRLLGGWGWGTVPDPVGCGVQGVLKLV